MLLNVFHDNIRESPGNLEHLFYRTQGVIKQINFYIVLTLLKTHNHEKIIPFDPDAFYRRSCIRSG